MRGNKISEYKIKRLKEDEWEIYFEEKVKSRGRDVFAVTYFKEKKIKIRKSLSPYELDKAIYHEIVHASYGESSLDWAGINNIYVEWIGRNIRSSPNLLSCIWREFSIPPVLFMI